MEGERREGRREEREGGWDVERGERGKVTQISCHHSILYMCRSCT